MKSIERPHSGTHQNYSAAPKVGRLDELKDWDFSTVIAEAQDGGPTSRWGMKK